MATWPDTLPQPTKAGYQGDAGANVLRTDFDAGPARQRLRYGDAPDDLTVGWKFKATEMAIFKDFWKNEINSGCDYFQMDLNIGDGMRAYEVRFVGGNYQYQILSGSNWQVSAKLDVRTI